MISAQQYFQNTKKRMTEQITLIIFQAQEYIQQYVFRKEVIEKINNQTLQLTFLQSSDLCYIKLKEMKKVISDYKIQLQQINVKEQINLDIRVAISRIEIKLMI
ncbi:unnamed protein product [Paramecium octaurelia]|uniref:Uncharacterized protein n=1 Tax=Paramecium octaurelia TaxID=43137 RepID=A0A8S1YDV6_PAROT|nr:unnamed protein product [Paramecium octaurelia]